MLFVRGHQRDVYSRKAKRVRGTWYAHGASNRVRTLYVCEEALSRDLILEGVYCSSVFATTRKNVRFKKISGVPAVL